ncbi:hypothetical protein FA10DRAFT_176430 [Acaromyces ingoldii]|uniref:Nudix hydrolase domain-containing protein n=1 Tax=Acaromyces ingoldii TaxID=215250 RepID=A0A316YEZ4_9BASI|nr:hypothetical protein FA10DRAFT_176430 [Acaromyces ingoldii]PWN87799.1 hypothetical protein FA10DRAFT_176430 [Acaromyces ingoldii]
MESARRCARRELKEETGYKAKAVRLGGPFKTEGQRTYARSCGSTRAPSEASSLPARRCFASLNRPKNT